MLIPSQVLRPGYNATFIYPMFLLTLHSTIARLTKILLQEVPASLKKLESYIRRFENNV